MLQLADGVRNELPITFLVLIFLISLVIIMYSMPLVGESARLYFPKESSEDPIVTGCIRKNEDTCEKISDTTQRYLGTEYASEIAMIPGALNIK